MSVVEVTWLGHATVLIAIDGMSILTDPVLTSRIGVIWRYAPPVDIDLLKRIDLVVVSHLHRDHLHMPSLQMLDHAVRTVVPRGGEELLRRAGLKNISEVQVGDSLWCGPVRITAVPAAHTGYRPPFGPKADAVGYLITGSGRIYFPGDTTLFDGMRDISPDLDLALLPVGGWGVTLRGEHLNPESAALALKLLRPRHAIPIHWGTLRPLGMRNVWRSNFEQPGANFAEYAAVYAPGVKVDVLQPGGRVGLRAGPEDL